MSLINHVLTKTFLEFPKLIKRPKVLVIGGISFLLNLLHPIFYVFLFIVQIHFISEAIKNINNVSYDEERNIVNKFFKASMYLILFAISIVAAIILFLIILTLIAIKKEHLLMIFAGGGLYILNSIAENMMLIFSFLIILIFLMSLLLIKICLIFYAILIDNEKKPITKSFDLTHGYVIKIFLMALIIGIPLIILSIVIFGTTGIIGLILIITISTIFIINIQCNLYERLKALKGLTEKETTEKR